MIKLIATSGDLSANGMSDTNSTKEVTVKQWKLIQAYQTFDHTAFLNAFGKGDAELCKKLGADYLKIQEDCRTFGCWSNKYEARTNWAKVSK